MKTVGFLVFFLGVSSAQTRSRRGREYETGQYYQPQYEEYQPPQYPPYEPPQHQIPYDQVYQHGNPQYGDKIVQSQEIHVPNYEGVQYNQVSDVQYYQGKAPVFDQYNGGKVQYYDQGKSLDYNDGKVQYYSPVKTPTYYENHQPVHYVPSHHHRLTLGEKLHQEHFPRDPNPFPIPERFQGGSSLLKSSLPSSSISNPDPHGPSLKTSLLQSSLPSSNSNSHGSSLKTSILKSSLPSSSLSSLSSSSLPSSSSHGSAHGSLLKSSLPSSSISKVSNHPPPHPHFVDHQPVEHRQTSSPFNKIFRLFSSSKSS